MEFSNYRPPALVEFLTKLFNRRKIFLIITIPLLIGILLFHFIKPYYPIYRISFDIGIGRNWAFQNSYLIKNSNQQNHSSAVNYNSWGLIEKFFSQSDENIDINALLKSIDGFPEIERLKNIISSKLQIFYNTPANLSIAQVIEDLLNIEFAEGVVDSLGLGAFIKEVNSSSFIKVEYKNELQNTERYDLIVNNDRTFSLITNNIKYKGATDEFIDAGSIRFYLDSHNPLKTNKIYTVFIYPRNKIALALKNSISLKLLDVKKYRYSDNFSKIPYSGEKLAKQLVQIKTSLPKTSGSEILRIDLCWGDRDNAIRIINEIVRQLRIRRISRLKLHYQRFLDIVYSQIDSCKTRMYSLEDSIKMFKIKNDITDYRTSTIFLIRQITLLEENKNKLMAEQEILKKAETNLFTQFLSDIKIDFSPALVSAQWIKKLYRQILETEVELKKILNQYTDNHPQYFEVKARLDGYKQELKEEISGRIRAINIELEAIDEQLIIIKSKLEQIPSIEITLACLNRDKETLEKLYQQLSERLEKLRINSANISPGIYLINSPVIPSNPVNRRLSSFSLIVSMCLVIIIGSAGILIVDNFDRTVRNPKLIRHWLKPSLLVTIPETSKKINGKEFREKKYVTDTQSELFEPFWRLLVNLRIIVQKELKVIYVTSPEPGAGKTYTSFNLALVMAMLGKKVLLIDTDFRKCKENLTDITKLNHSNGLYEFLTGDFELDSLVRVLNKTAFNSYVYFLPVGNVPNSFGNFFETKKMEQLLELAKQKYDHIIIDGLPLLLFADPLYLSNFTDVTLLTVNYGRTEFKALKISFDTIKSSIIGVVVNNYPGELKIYRYYRKKYKSEEEVLKPEASLSEL